MTSVSHADYDRLLLGSPLRRRPVCIVICVALLAALSLATLIHLGLLASMRLDVKLFAPRPSCDGTEPDSAGTGVGNPAPLEVGRKSARTCAR